MRKLLTLISATLWLAAATAQAAPWEPGLVARIHFAGGNAVAADTNSVPVQNAWSIPEAQALRTQTLDKLARFLDGWLRAEVAPTLVPAWQSRPLLNDLCLAEWQLEVRQPAPGTAQFSLAVRLDEGRAQAWQMLLNPLLTGWKQSSPAHHSYIVAKGGWLYFSLDNAPTPAVAGSIASLNHAWLTAEVDWARLAVWFPAVAKFDIPQTRLQVGASHGQFEATGRLYLAQPLPPLEKWQFPTNLVHSPFLSFTAARGISDWLRQQPWAVSLGINPLPDQIFTWVEPQIPFLTYAAMPLPNASAALSKIDQSVSEELQLLARPPNFNFQALHLDTAKNQINLVGLPLVAPYLQARHEAAGDFLVSGFIPIAARGRPAPPELLARLKQSNLLYYHWEITAERLRVFPELYQLMFLVTGHRQLELGTAADKWLQRLGPTLGPTVTTATEISPTELNFERRAAAGLTAVELIALASWLEAPDFPGCDLRLPPPRRHPHPHPAPGSPAPNVFHP